MPRATLLRQRLLLLFLAGMLLLFSPLVMQLETSEHWLGLPALFVYLFAAWAALIGVAAWIVARTRD